MTGEHASALAGAICTAFVLSCCLQKDTPGQAISKPSSCSSLVGYLEEVKGTPFACERRINEVAALKTPAALEALLRFAASAGGSYHETLAAAMNAFGPEIVPDLQQAYRADVFAGYPNGRLVLAEAAALLAKTDDEALVMMVSLCFDDYNEVMWAAEAALRERRQRSAEIIGKMINEAQHDEERGRLENLLKEVEGG